MSGSNTTAQHGILDDKFALFACKGLFSAPSALAGNLTLDDTYPSILKLDPNGSDRNITLDAVATSKGMYRRIINAASDAHNLVVKNAGGSTIGTANQNEQAEFYCDGSTWALICVTTIALS